jgi:formylglycine-generating enzyme required for sulfatase activity
MRKYNTIFYKRMVGIILFFILGLFVSISIASTDGPEQNKIVRLYEKHETWQQTMLETRKLFRSKRSGDQPVIMGPMYNSFSLKKNYISGALAGTRKINLNAKSDLGQPIWQITSRNATRPYYYLPEDGTKERLLYRTLTVAKPTEIVADVDFNGELKVFLNGLNVFKEDEIKSSQKVRIKLNLKIGENDLLLKVKSTQGPRNSGMFISLQDEAALHLWKKIAEDFPVQSYRMEFDLDLDGVVSWFSIADNVDLEERMIESVFDSKDQIGEKLWEDFKALYKMPVQPDDPRYLDFYVHVCRFRKAFEDLKKVNFRALRMAVQDLSKTFPDQYSKSKEFLKRAFEYEQHLPEIKRSLQNGGEKDLDHANRYIEKVVDFQRESLLANPLLNFEKLLFVKRKPLGNPYRYEEPDRGLGQLVGMPKQSSWQLQTMPNIYDWDNEIASLSPVRPNGEITTIYKSEKNKILSDMDLHFDGTKLLFSMPDDKRFWQLYELNLEGNNIRQITGDAPDVHSFDACYLPDDQIAFVSTASFQGVPCNSGVNVGMIYRMDENGQNIRQLCFEQDHNFCPTVMNDGRIMYLRWEYTDIPHVWARFLFTMNPAGTGQKQLLGSGSYWPNAIFYARPIPGHPTKVAGIVTGHHVGRVGELYVFDPAQGRKADESVVQQIPGYGKKVEPIIKDKLAIDSWPKLLHPFPLNENYFLVSCRPTREDMWGIYLVDTFDNIVLIKEVEGQALLEPIPFVKTKKPPVLAEMINLKRKDATVYIENIYKGSGLKGLPKGLVKSLRLFTYHFAYRTVAGINHRVGADGPWEPKRVLGTVPVEKDGSAMFRVPANTPISIQPLDKEGKALQLMRSWMTAMPGEFVSCIGCHESLNSSARNHGTIATGKPPSEIQPWYGPVRGFSFMNEVQPVLDRNCVSCHDGTGNVKPDLRGEQGKYICYKNGSPEAIIKSGVPREKLLKNYGGVFPPSYIELRRRVRVGGLESDLRVLSPGEFHADNSELIQMLNKGHHGVDFDSESMDRLVTWIDLNAPCYGTWQQVVGPAKIANDHQRRCDLASLYAGLDADPESMVRDLQQKLGPIKPKVWPTVKVEIPEITGWPLKEKDAKEHQKNIKKKNRSIDLGDGCKLDLEYIPAGQFVMGDANGHPDEHPLSSVEIDQPFWIAKYEITNEQYSKFDPSHDSRFEHKGSWQFNKVDIGWDLNKPNQPVVRISQVEAMAFCQWLSQKIGQKVLLPTEAQWEYACRAGTETPFSFGDLDTDFSDYANMADWTIRDLVYDVRDQYPPDLVPRESRFNDLNLVTAEVGSYKPNRWGLFDMHGNVWEWTRSTLKAYPYQDKDGRNAIDGRSDKIVRGGSWYDHPKRCRSGYRLNYPEWQKVNNVGFRVILGPEKSSRLTVR